MLRFCSLLCSKRTLHPPITVALTGPIGNIGYSLLPRICAGDVFGRDQPLHLSLIELPGTEDKLHGVMMELNDGAYPLLEKLSASTDVEEGFADCDCAILIGAKPRGKGQERSDLLRDNGRIFELQGKALEKVAKTTCRVLVVGNPANTNALILQSWAKKLKPSNVAAMMRLDQTRALFQLSVELGVETGRLDHVIVWGNHSASMVPDVKFAYHIEDGSHIPNVSDEWLTKYFRRKVQQRGAEVIAARGSSSALSAANAAAETLRYWWHGTGDHWCCVAILSDGSYGITPGLFFGVPATCSQRKWTTVKDLDISHVRDLINATHAELLQEAKDVKDFIAPGTKLAV